MIGHVSRALRRPARSRTAEMPVITAQLAHENTAIETSEPSSATYSDILKLAHVSQPRTEVINLAWGSSLDRNDEKIQGRVAPRWNETKETVLFAFGEKRPRKETLWVALA
jgi:hypothetical protein